MAPKLRLPQQSYIFFVALMLVMLALMWEVFRPFVIYMVTGVFVAVLAGPIDKFWEKRLHNRMSAIMTMATVFVLLTLPVVGLGISLASDARDLTEAIQEGQHDEWVENSLDSDLVQRVLPYLYPDNTTEERNERVFEAVDNLEGFALEQLTELARRVAAAAPGFLLATMVILFVVYYVLTDGPRLVAYIKRAAPMPRRQVQFLMDEANNGIRAVFIGQILTSTIQGALGGIAFLITGVPGAVVWAAVMAVLSLLPVVGAFLVWLPAAAYLFFLWSQGEAAIWRPIFMLAWGAIVVSQVDNFIRPKLIGDRANIHPMFVLIGVLGGVAAFGFIGLFLGPLIVGVMISILKVWEEVYLDPVVGEDDPTSAEDARITALAQEPAEPPEPPAPPEPPSNT